MSTSRQLAAIMFTDIAGYTTLMGKDSQKALEIVRLSREIQKPLVEKHKGRWIKDMGDGALAQFGTALDAVNCAIEIQYASRADFEADLRIGIHLGDITIENNDVFGDGVNVAARLESIADPGGIYISDSVFKSIQGQTDIRTEDLGEVQLKNVTYKVRTYALQGPGFPAPTLDNVTHSKSGKRRSWVYAAGAIVLAVLSLSVYFWYFSNTSESAGIGTEAHIEQSIAVLPFENRSNLEDDEFFTDGVHDDLLTQISKISEIKTISRTSVKEYRNTTKNVRTIGEELGVATILEGGVQRAGNQIRINVQLTDTKTNAHLWAETYTRELSIENIFAIQSEIAQAIATALATVLSPEERQNIEKLPTQNLAALEAYFHAMASIDKNNNEGFREAEGHLNLAIQLDTTFAIAYAELGILTIDRSWYEGLPISEQLAKGKPLIEKAVRLDSTSSEVQLAFGRLKGYEQDIKARELAYQKAIELNPNNARAYTAYGNLLIRLGRNDQGIEYLFKAKELDPKNDGLGIALASQLSQFGRFIEARQIAEEIIVRKPDYAQAYFLLANIAFYYDHQLAECLRLNHKVVMLNPGFPFQSLMIGFIYKILGDKVRVNMWFNHAFSLSSDFMGAPLARGYIYELRGEYNKAFIHYLNATEHLDPNQWVFQETMLQLMELGLETNRITEVIDHFRKVIPGLFQSDVLIDESNLIPAYALGMLLKANGELEQAEQLLNKSLKIAQTEMHTGNTSPEHNPWECRIHLALGNHQAAIASFVKLVADGVLNDDIVSNPIYKPLYDDPDFQKSMEIMKKRLDEERAMVKDMEKNGELDIPPLP